MKTYQILRRIFLPLVALALLFLSACDEHPTGNGPAGGATVSGTLNDEYGFIVPGASIVALNANGAEVTSVVTTDEGTFTLKGLPEDMQGIHVHVSQPNFLPLVTPLQDIVSMAGGTSGVLVSVMHSDSCCGHLTVHVTGANGPLAGVEVRLRTGDHLITTGHTDANGNVTFNHVCVGEYNLRLAREGYIVAERGGIHVTGCDTVRTEFSMRAAGNDHNGERDSCCNGKLRIKPLDSATGAAITGANVRISKTGMDSRTIITNGDGALFRELCAGTYNVRIAKDGYRVIEYTVTLSCNDSVYSDHRMAPNGDHNNDSCCHGALQITLRDSTGNAVIAGAGVQLRKGDRTWNGTTNGDGRVAFDGLCNGDYTLVITKDGFVRQEIHLSLGCNQHLEREYHMAHVANNDSCCHGVLTIIVRDSTTNAVIAGATVKLWKGGQLFETGTTNGDGRVIFDGLCNGSYALSFQIEGYGSREMSLGLECNQHREITEKLLHNGENHDSCCNAVFSFRAKDSSVVDGGWLTGVSVRIMRGNETIVTGTTNAEGRYTREGICGYATYTVIFSKDGYHSKYVTYTLTSCRTIDETIKLVHN